MKSHKIINIIAILILMFTVTYILLDGVQAFSRQPIVRSTPLHNIVITRTQYAYPAPIEPTQTVHPYVAPPTSTPWPSATPKQTPTANPDI
jgi:hypothetical protein